VPSSGKFGTQKSPQNPAKSNPILANYKYKGYTKEMSGFAALCKGSMMTLSSLRYTFFTILTLQKQQCDSKFRMEADMN